MDMKKERVLAHDMSRELTVYELDAISGGLAPTGTTISGGGGTCHDTDDSTTGSSSECK